MLVELLADQVAVAVRPQVLQVVLALLDKAIMAVLVAVLQLNHLEAVAVAVQVQLVLVVLLQVQAEQVQPLLLLALL
jgi:hypothetical protein